MIEKLNNYVCPADSQDVSWLGKLLLSCSSWLTANHPCYIWVHRFLQLGPSSGFYLWSIFYGWCGAGSSAFLAMSEPVVESCL